MEISIWLWWLLGWWWLNKLRRVNSSQFLYLLISVKIWNTKIEKKIIKLILNEKTIQALYEQYTVKYGVKVDIDNNKKIDKSVLVKALKQKKQEQENLLKAISSGLIAGMALESTSNKFNSISERNQDIRGSNW